MDGFMSEIRLFAGSFVPRGWANCDGAILPINQHQALFSLIGANYGGDARTTFCLPDLPPPPVAPHAPDHAPRYIICVDGTYPSRD